MGSRRAKPGFAHRHVGVVWQEKGPREQEANPLEWFPNEVRQHARGWDFGGVLRKLAEARSSGGVVELEVGEDDALMRALRHFRNRRLSPGLQQLWYTYQAVGAGSGTYTYDLELRRDDGTIETSPPLFHLRRQLQEGRSPPARGRRTCWQIVDVVLSPGDEENDRLICTPCRSS